MHWQTIFYYFKIGFLYLLVMSIFLLPIWVKSSSAIHTKQVLGTSTKIDTKLGTPTRIKIPRLNVDLPVIHGTYSQQAWDLSPKEALFAEGTALPNKESGNTLIYGHNTSDVFSKTAQLKTGDTVFVFTNSQHIFVYEYVSDEIVKPTDTSIFSYKGDPQLTLLTCNGFLDSHRRLMFFKLVSAI